jgi:subtilase family serine protease
VSKFLHKTACRYRKAGTLALLGACSWLALTGTSNAFEKAALGSPAAREQAVQFDIYLPVQDRAGVEALIDELHTPGSASYHKWLTPAQYNERFGASETLVNSLKVELAAHGLQVTEVHAHSLHVSGTVAAVNEAFNTSLATARFASGRQTMAAMKPLQLTPALASANAMVAAFSGTTHMKAFATPAGVRGVPDNRSSPTGGYWFDDLKQAYSYPSYKKLTGKGVQIGVLMENNFNPPDMKLYFSHEKLATPTITTVNIEGGSPFDGFNSAETHIDITHSGGMAPAAAVTLYNLPDLDDDSILAGITTIIEDNVVDVVNMSFGGPEAQYAPAYNNGTNLEGILGIYDDFFAEGNTLGITWVAASGDWGGKAIPAPACFSASPPSPCGPMEVGVSTPATSPHVTAVGGTNLVTTYNPPSLESEYVTENANFDALFEDIFYGTSATGAVWGSGGGISIYYAKPSYQNLVSQRYLPASARKWRTIPDLALEMGGCPGAGVIYVEVHGVCPPNRSFDETPINGAFYGYIGTSLSSPDFVGLVALKIQSVGGRLGNVNYEIYSLAAAQANGSFNKVFRQDIPGNNGVYSTAPGYNLVLGNGTVIANDFVQGPSLPAAGVPQTPTNP